MRRTAMVALAATIVGVVGVATGSPAGAAIAFTSSGTVVTAAVTGSGSVQFSCVGGTIRALGANATPPVACTAVTRVVVNGDSFAQFVFADTLDSGAFPALATTSILTGGGDDLVFGTKVDDFVWTATGGDQVYLPATGIADSLVLVGDEFASDVVNLVATGANEQITVTSTSASETTVTNGSWSAPITANFVSVSAGAGNDVVDARGLAATLEGFDARGEEGNDTLWASPQGSQLDGGPGTNTLNGGAGVDQIRSAGPADVITSGAGADLVRDVTSGRVGGRTLNNPTGAKDSWIVSLPGDAVVRSRPTSATSSTVTAALSRTGRQSFGTGSGELTYDTSGTPADRVLFELTPLKSHPQRIIDGGGALIDLVVPTGVTWTVTGGTISFTGGYQNIVAFGAMMRRPFTDPNTRFAHRVIRDLDHRIPSVSERDQVAAQLSGGSRTRAQIVLSYSSTDSFRGIGVDRTYVDVLRRLNDASGRLYWISRLRDGLPLRKLRANLYGSNEYFNRFGDGDVESYVASAYRDILGRESDAPGRAYWVGLIEGGTARGTVAERFLNTPEARRVVIGDLFLRWADRDPTPSEQATWLTTLSSTTTDGELALVRFLAAGTEYFTRPDI